MKITNLETRAYLALNAPYWLGRIEKATNTADLYDTEEFRGYSQIIGKSKPLSYG